MPPSWLIVALCSDSFLLSRGWMRASRGTISKNHGSDGMFGTRKAAAACIIARVMHADCDQYCRRQEIVGMVNRHRRVLLDCLFLLGRLVERGLGCCTAVLPTIAKY